MRGQYAITLLLVLGLAPAAWGQKFGPPPGTMGPAMVPGPRAAMGNPSAPVVKSTLPFFQPGFRPGFHPGFHPGFDRHRPFHRRDHFFPWVPWGGYYYVPDYQAEYQAAYEEEQAAARAQQEADEDRQRHQALQQSIDDLRAYNEMRDRELEQERLARAAAPPEPQAPPEPAIILIFKDGHRAQVFNYAIMGDTLYDLSGGHSRKIPLAELDLEATTKLNEENGVDFRLPGRRNPA